MKIIVELGKDKYIMEEFDYSLDINRSRHKYEKEEIIDLIPIMKSIEIKDSYLRKLVTSIRHRYNNTSSNGKSKYRLSNSCYFIYLVVLLSWATDNGVDIELGGGDIEFLDSVIERNGDDRKERVDVKIIKKFLNLNNKILNKWITNHSVSI